MKIALDTLGCKLNQAETDSLARQFAEAGHRLVSRIEEADIYILNTCTVTHIADAKSRHLLRLARRRNSSALLVATGCYAQRLPQELAEIEGVNLVASNAEKPDLLRLLEDSGVLDKPASATEDCSSCYESQTRTRAFIKIQDGCSKFCSYCIVPRVRGREISLPANMVITEIKQRAADGVKEIVLTGTEIGTYSDNGTNLKDLLANILNETDAARLRLSSLQPGEISEELIGLWHDHRLCPHFHLSVQSGSDSVLRRMKRNYSTEDYRNAVSLIRSMVPDVAITTDVITGFPGETEEEFEESYHFCRRMEFSRIHVFPYSARSGTAAARMPNQVADRVKKQRNQKSLTLAGECASSFNRSFSGRTMPVLWERQSDGVWSGHTPNYIKVYTRSDENLANKIEPVVLGEPYRDGVWSSKATTPSLASETRNRL